MESTSRYSRHLAIDGFASHHQNMLQNARVLVVGAGGLGAPVLLYLTAAGVGHLGIVDDDTVSISNLQRQILYDERDVGKHKGATACQKLNSLNSHAAFTHHNRRLSSENAKTIISLYDVVVDCTDNYLARQVINDTCRQLNKSWVYGAVENFSGQVAVFSPDQLMDYDALFGNLTDDSNRIVGVIGAMPGIIGSIQALEVIKLITGTGETLCNKLLTFDGKTMTSQIVQLA